MTIKLSVCIPTYNRARFIGETLESIIRQATDEIEIVVSDNASEDNTKEIVEQYKTIFPRITYYCQSQNMGADYNYLKIVELAGGEYCWLFGSDDVLKPGAISRILAEIELGYDIYLCNRTLCDLNLNPLKEKFWLSKKINDRVFNFSNKSELIDYLNASQSLGALFSYISSIIVCHKKWDKIKCYEQFIGSAYVHVFKLFSMTRDGLFLKYIQNSLVLCRAGNDSFAEDGIVSRYLLDIDGYLRLADNLMADDYNVKAAFLQVMMREYPWYEILRVRLLIGQREQWQQLENKMLKFGYNHKTLVLCDKLAKYRKLVSVVVYLRRKICALVKKLKYATRLSMVI